MRSYLTPCGAHTSNKLKYKGDSNILFSRKRREIFIHNLKQEGLIVNSGENDGMDIKNQIINFTNINCKYAGNNNLQFIKITAPLEILCRYAEILKIRMPIKKFSAEMLHSESAEGANMLEFKLEQIDGSGGQWEGSTIEIPIFSDVHHEIKSWLEKIQEPFYPSNKLLRNKSQYTAIFSR